MAIIYLLSTFATRRFISLEAWLVIYFTAALVRDGNERCLFLSEIARGEVKNNTLPQSQI
jgi:hypothetical protein